jgi:hypothetical protein
MSSLPNIEQRVLRTLAQSGKAAAQGDLDHLRALLQQDLQAGRVSPQEHREVAAELDRIQALVETQHASSK